MLISANAKINLGLDVTGRRDDGYHLVRMVMQELELCDTLTIEEAAEEGVRLETDRADLPADGTNLICKAAGLFLNEYCPGKGVRISLRKRIPMAAGLAGGSADAAAALRGLDRLFGRGLSMEELCRMGVRIGADVPFCLMGGAALAEGIGEILTPLPAMPACRIVLVKPPCAVSTADVYRAFDGETRVAHPDIDGQARAMRNGDLKEVLARMGNVLAPVTARKYPGIRTIRERLLDCGAEGAQMSGSGPTVFGAFLEETLAEQACEVIKKEMPSADVILTAPVRKGGGDR